MLSFLSLGIVRASLIPGHYGCKDDKEHASRALHQLTMYAFNPLAQLSILLGETRDRYLPIVPFLRLWCSIWATKIQVWKGALLFSMLYYCLEGNFAKCSIVLLIKPGIVPNEHQDIEMMQKRGYSHIIEFSRTKVMTTVVASTKPKSCRRIGTFMRLQRFGRFQATLRPSVTKMPASLWRHQKALLRQPKNL